MTLEIANKLIQVQYPAKGGATQKHNITVK